MNANQEDTARGSPPAPCTDEEVRRLAERCLADPDHAAARIDRSITAATASGRWEDVLLWQRVRLRVRRLTMAQAARR